MEECEEESVAVSGGVGIGQSGDGLDVDDAGADEERADG